MNLFSRIFRSRKSTNLVTLRERDRLSKTMPGQVGAVAANRYGFLIR